MEPEISNIFRDTETFALKNNRSSPQENLYKQSRGKGGLVVIKMIYEEERHLPMKRRCQVGWFFAELVLFCIFDGLTVSSVHESSSSSW